MLGKSSVFNSVLEVGLYHVSSLVQRYLCIDLYKTLLETTLLLHDIQPSHLYNQNFILLASIFAQFVCYIES